MQYDVFKLKHTMFNKGNFRSFVLVRYEFCFTPQEIYICVDVLPNSGSTFWLFYHFTNFPFCRNASSTPNSKRSKVWSKNYPLQPAIVIKSVKW